MFKSLWYSINTFAALLQFTCSLFCEHTPHILTCVFLCVVSLHLVSFSRNNFRVFLAHSNLPSSTRPESNNWPHSRGLQWWKSKTSPGCCQGRNQQCQSGIPWCPPFCSLEKRVFGLDWLSKFSLLKGWEVKHPSRVSHRLSDLARLALLPLQPCLCHVF